MSSPSHSTPTIMDLIMRVLKSTGLDPETNFEKFKSLENGNQRVDFVYEYLKKSKAFHEIVDKPKSLKSNEESQDYRKKGNDAFIRSKIYFEAFKLYTQSIAHAESNSSELGLAYGNRSALLFEKKYYHECILDIDRALQYNYPEHLKEKIVNRRQKAIELKLKRRIINYCAIIPVINNKHPRILAASDAIDIRTNEKVGKHIVATKNIAVGDIISVESSYAHVVTFQNRLVHCNECLNLCYTLIPCDNCTMAMYCSEFCKNQAQTFYHKYECDMITIFVRFSLIFLRVFLVGVTRNTPETDLDDRYCSDRFKEIINLETMESKRDFVNMFFPAALACLAYYSLTKHSKFFDDYDIPRDYVKDTLYKCAMIESVNSFTISKSLTTLNKDYSEKVAAAMLSFSSLYNHSCGANCMFFYHGKNLVVRAMRNIRRNEECNVCYGYSYTTHTIEERQSMLKEVYFFDCECKACKKKWPLFEKLPLGKDLPLAIHLKILNNEYIDESKREVKNVEKVLEEFIPLHNKLERWEPCQSLATVRMVLTEVYNYTGNKVLEF